ncbi:hypothetical protein V6N12_010432 [Hibiscus sabdariffa]|uniref:Uncharacterized protein n=1 Tax=Hibiscus sabdariffa TaxID=183260 RepID=A0ABR2EK22_9ROSI
MCKEGAYWGKYDSTYTAFPSMIMMAISKHARDCNLNPDIPSCLDNYRCLLFVDHRNCSWSLCGNGVWGREDPWHNGLGFKVAFCAGCGILLQKNAMIGGALVSAATHNDKDRVVSDALAGGAIATASVFLN